MSDKTELPKEWIDYSINEYSDDLKEQVGFRDGAKAMRDEVEKMLKDEVASIQREHDRTDSLQYQSDLNQQKQALINLHFKLQYLTPTQDGK